VGCEAIEGFRLGGRFLFSCGTANVQFGGKVSLLVWRGQCVISGGEGTHMGCVPCPLCPVGWSLVLSDRGSLLTHAQSRTAAEGTQ